VKKEEKQASTPKDTEDERFAQVFVDPRFAVQPHKEKKVAVDERFKEMFSTSKKNSFNVVSKVDKYGRKISKHDAKQVMENYYQSAETGLTKRQEEIEAIGNKYYDADGKFLWNNNDSESSSDSESDSDDSAY
jgi:hypothetical protein